MIISITNPINDEIVEIDMEIVTTVSTYPNGTIILSVNGTGQTTLQAEQPTG